MVDTVSEMGLWMPRGGEPSASQVDEYAKHIGIPPGILMDIRIPGPPVLPGSDKSCGDVVITAIPADWDINNLEGYPSWDTDIIYELFEAVDAEQVSQTQEELDEIENELGWITHVLIYPQGSGIGPYFFIDDGQFPTGRRHASHLVDDNYEFCMSHYEEDYEYEQSLTEEKKMNMKVNLHRLLACPFDKRPGWCGYVGHAASGRDNEDWSFRKERYRWQVEIVHSHPQGKRGYALGKTDYGYIYFPEKFRGYIPEVGMSVETTVALQDIGKTGEKGNAFRFTAIYTH